MAICRSILLVLATAIASLIVHAQQAAPVPTTEGLVTGVATALKPVEAFKGIPFAAPPVGVLRWREPQPTPKRSQTYAANDFGASCMQAKLSRLPWTAEFMTHGTLSEDCLYLNIWTPRADKDAKLPVLFWIYGGGFSEGSSAVPVYDGTQLAGTGMVVVTINYRVGALGFMAHPELTAESPHHSSGNYGLLDQLAALKWVGRNIEAFGGDPSRILIDGQSAGAASVHDLVATPLAKGMFAAGIAESGSGITSFPTATLDGAEKQGVAYAQSLGAKDLAELRKLPSSRFIPAEGVPGQQIRFSPVVDGYYFPESPDEILAQGKQNDVPFLTGLTADDARTLNPRPLDTTAWNAAIAERYGALSSDFLRLYPSETDAQARQAQIDSARDRGKVSMYLWALHVTGKVKSPVYTYYFTHPIPWPAHPEFGAFHDDDIPYVFRNLAIFDRPWTQVDQEISKITSSYWKNFAKEGDPNGTELPLWKPVSTESPQTLEIGDNTREVPLASPEKVDFWNRYFQSPISKSAPLF